MFLSILDGGDSGDWLMAFFNYFLESINWLPNTIIYIEGQSIISHQHHSVREDLNFIVLKLLLNLFKHLILIFNILDLFLFWTLKGSPWKLSLKGFKSWLRVLDTGREQEELIFGFSLTKSSSALFSPYLLWEEKLSCCINDRRRGFELIQLFVKYPDYKGQSWDGLMFHER